jgi:hypothetical protein
MKRRFLLALAAVLVLGAMPALAQVSTTIEYGDITQNGWVWLGSAQDRWDLTECDLTLSYTLDMSGYSPPMWQTEWSSVGVGEGAWGWMASGAPAAAETNPDSQDMDDKLNLGAPDRYDEASYDATDPETLVSPPIGNPWANYGVWFDRDGVDPCQAGMWGMIDGKTYNTGGVYDVVVTYHAIDANLGTMFATVNGVQTGFYDAWKNAQPDYYPVGKSISGDLTRLRVLASIWGQNVKVYNLTASGCPWTEVEIDIKPGSYPNSINLCSRGVIPVAILSGGGFDATTIDPTTVAFAGAYIRVKGKGALQYSFEDVDGDGDLDFVAQIAVENLDLDRGSTEATISGFAGGVPFRGADSVNIVKDCE